MKHIILPIAVCLYVTTCCPAGSVNSSNALVVYTKDMGSSGKVTVTCTNIPLNFTPKVYKNKSIHDELPTAQYRYDLYIVRNDTTIAAWSGSKFYDYDPPSPTGPLTVFDVYVEDDTVAMLAKDGLMSKPTGGGCVAVLSKFDRALRQPGSEVSLKEFAWDSTMFPPVCVTGGHFVGSYKTHHLRVLLDNSSDGTLIYQFDGTDWKKAAS